MIRIILHGFSTAETSTMTSKKEADLGYVFWPYERGYQFYDIDVIIRGAPSVGTAA